MFSRISDPTKSAEISKQIDKLFEERDDQTETMSERAFQLSWLGAFAAERVHEYGILRAIGFRPGHILGFILGEAVLVALVGGALGILLTLGMVNGVLGPWIEENMGAIFIQFHTPLFVMGLAIGLAVLLGIIAGLVPAIGASRRKVTDALRRID
jgi:putative ABC transport system permease protein